MWDSSLIIRNAAALVKRGLTYGIPQVCCERKSSPSEEYDRCLREAVRQFAPDPGSPCRFMRLLGRDFLDEFREKSSDIHPSLLPAFRGLDAQNRLWITGSDYTGCTVHFVDEGTDTGPIIGQRVVPVMPDDTEDTLTARILVKEHALMVECINAVLTGRVRRDGRKVIVCPYAP